MTAYVDAGVIAKLMGVKQTTVRRWAREGRIPFLRPTGRVLRFDPDAVERALRERAVRSTPKPPEKDER
jgi:excisionase family DNA binding protein